jgi:hypothetical protein
MQASLIGLRHLEQARIPISARLYSGLGWADGTMLALDQAGSAKLSVTDNYRQGAVMARPGHIRPRSCWSIQLTSRKH